MSISDPTLQKHNTSLYSSLMFGILLIAANLRAPITSLGPVLSQVSDFFNLGNVNAGLLNALPLLIFGLGSPLAPWLIRRVGLEKALALALLMITLGCVIRSSGFNTGLWAGTFLLGAGIAIANVLVVPLVKRDFPEHTALCVGLYAATMAMMASIASGIASPLSSLSQLGWKVSLGIWTLLGLLALIVWIPQLHKPKQHLSNVTAPAKTSLVWSSPLAWCVSMFMALQTMVFYTLIDWFPAIAETSAISAKEAGFYLSAYQAVAVLANLTTSVLIKRSKDQRIIGLVCSMAIAIGLAGLLLMPTWSLIWLLFAGVGAGMSMVTCLTLFGLRTSDHHLAGALSGMAQCVGYLLGATGPYLAGYLHAKTGNWESSLVVLIIAALVQAVFAYAAGRNKVISYTQ